MKKLTSIAITSLLIIGIFSSSALAGSARRHTIEGALIGAGVVLLGSAIAHSYDRPDPVKVYRHHSDYQPPKGHWETRKIWVEPKYTSRWNPGHYNKHGRWVSGKYESFSDCRGHWESRRVWVPHYCRY